MTNTGYAVIFLIIGTLMTLAANIWKLRSSRYTAEVGGRIDSIREEKDERGEPVYCTDYSYEVYKHQYRRTVKSDAFLGEPGDEIKVKYDPTAPEFSYIYGVALPPDEPYGKKQNMLRIAGLVLDAVGIIFLMID